MKQVILIFALCLTSSIVSARNKHNNNRNQKSTDLSHTSTYDFITTASDDFSYTNTNDLLTTDSYGLSYTNTHDRKLKPKSRRKKN